jgi:major membrane immunogen (membrane-anchored lipoprotein)
MKKMTIAIVICGALSLTACSNSSDPESSHQTTSTDPNSEQNWTTVTEQQAPPADQSADTGAGIATQTEQAAFEAGEAVKERADAIEESNKE